MSDDTQVRIDADLIDEAAAELEIDEDASAARVASTAIKQALNEDEPVATATLDDVGETIKEANESALENTTDELAEAVDEAVEEDDPDPAAIAEEVAGQLRPQLMAASLSHLQDAELLREVLPIEDGALRVREVED
jgi:N-acetylglucosamine kinase-like BadF-type ATPase